jgi:acetyl esterase
MALDPQVKQLLEQLGKMEVPAIHELAPEESRNLFRNSVKHFAAPPEAVAKVEDRRIPVKDGEIDIRIYTPSGEGPFPVFVYFHGGGWVLGDLDTLDSPLRTITNRANCVVVSVDYRLAPEHKFPTAVEDGYLATKWVAENAASFSGDPRRIAVGGDSAGGNIAAVVALMAREKKEPALCFQVLIYPVTDVSKNYPSYYEFGKGLFLTEEDMLYFGRQYLRTEADRFDIHVSPMLAEDLSGLPPALVVTAEYDPLRDEGEAYASRLEEAGVPVELCRYEGMIHGFFNMTKVLDQANHLVQKVADVLKRAF